VANETGCKTLDKLGNDPRVESVWYEYDSGYWVGLNEGWWCSDMECGTIHEATIAEVLKMVKFIERDPRPEGV
jgi:hypothetical protein